jgi:hypothetical protein
MKKFTDLDTFIALKYNLTSSNFLECIDQFPGEVLYNIADRLDVGGKKWPESLVRNMIRVKYRLNNETVTEYIRIVVRQELLRYHRKENE